MVTWYQKVTLLARTHIALYRLNYIIQILLYVCHYIIKPSVNESAEIFVATFLVLGPHSTLYKLCAFTMNQIPIHSEVYPNSH